jgi:hypothetical protein
MKTGMLAQGSWITKWTWFERATAAITRTPLRLAAWPIA